MTRAAILGVAGTQLTPEEAALFRQQRPLGAILFARNIDHPAQLRALTAALREVLGETAPILVDQEGGRVARLGSPHWQEFPPATVFEGGPASAAEANAALLGSVCADAGFDVVCAPVLDLRLPDAHGVIGDRAFSADPAEVSRLGAAWVAGLHAAGVQSVVKHIPGHGRAAADSHFELPRVTADRVTLGADLTPFRAVAKLAGWAMTAHIVYDALDPDRPATLSPRILGGTIRAGLGFEGVLISDDLAMKALSGSVGDLATAALGAGCDVVLHCTGRHDDNAALLAACPPLSDRAAERLARARALAKPATGPAHA